MKTFLPYLFLIIFLISCKQDDEVLQKTTSYDVYIAGTDSNKACYWKNNIKTNLNGGDNIIPDKIIVDNGNVYIMGHSTNPENYYFWKNNVKQEVAQYLNTPSNIGFPAYTNIKMVDFKVYNNEVYFLGYIRNPFTPIPILYEYCYWKNGNKTVLNTQYLKSFPEGKLALHNNEVYVTSIKIPEFELGYYKNNVYTAISTGNNLLSYGMESNANGIFMLIHDQTTGSSHYKNLFNNTDLYPMSGSQHDVILDGNDIYSNGGVDNYFKNGISQPFNINDDFKDYVDMKVMNQNQYLIKKKFNQGNSLNVSYRAYINGVKIMEIVETANNANLGGRLNSIFVVKN